MFIKKDYLIRIIFLCSFLLILANLFAVYGVDGGPLPPTVPFVITGSVSPDKSFYEKDDIVTFTGTIKIDRNHFTYIEGKQYHVKWSVPRAESISSNIDSLFIMDDNNDSLTFHITAKVKKLTSFVQLGVGISRIGINEMVQGQINAGMIPPDAISFPRVQWALYHDRKMFKSIFNSNAIEPNELEHKRYPHKKLNLNDNRDHTPLMYDSEFRFKVEDMIIDDVSVDNGNAFYGNAICWLLSFTTH